MKGDFLHAIVWMLGSSSKAEVRLKKLPPQSHAALIEFSIAGVEEGMRKYVSERAWAEPSPVGAQFPRRW